MQNTLSASTVTKKLRRAGKWVLLLLLSVTVPTLAKDDSEKEEPKPAKNLLKGKDAEELVHLRREVDALETLYHLEPTEAQMKGLLKLAEHTASKPKAATEAVATADYRTALREFRNALANEDEEKVDELSQKLAELNAKDPTDIEEGFEITEAARKAAPEALKLFTAAQVVSFLAAQESEVPDPVERIILTLHEGEELAEENWKELRQETADEVAWLVYGFDMNQSKSAAKQTADLLDRAHKLKGEALKKEMANLEKAAKAIVNGRGPTVILEHYMQRELAELLSNPQAVAALKARLANEKK